MRELNGADAAPYPTAADLLRAYRTRHVISAVRTGFGWIDAHCGLEVLPTGMSRTFSRPPRIFRHNLSQVNALITEVEGPASQQLCSNWLRCRHVQCVNARAREIVRAGAGGPSGLEAYRMVRTELSDPATRLEDLDPAYVEAARAYAARAHQAWPPRRPR